MYFYILAVNLIFLLSYKFFYLDDERNCFWKIPSLNESKSYLNIMISYWFLTTLCPITRFWVVILCCPTYLNYFGVVTFRDFHWCFLLWTTRIPTPFSLYLYVSTCVGVCCILLHFLADQCSEDTLYFQLQEEINSTICKCQWIPCTQGLCWQEFNKKEPVVSIFFQIIYHIKSSQLIPLHLVTTNYFLSCRNFYLFQMFCISISVFVKTILRRLFYEFGLCDSHKENKKWNT